MRSLPPQGGEESPGSTGQGAGEIPVGVNPRKVPQRHTARHSFKVLEQCIH